MAFEALTNAETAAGQFTTQPLWRKVKNNFDSIYGTTSGVIVVPNGSFEIDSDNDGQPDQWTTTALTGGTIGLETTSPLEGTKSLKMVAPGGAGNGGGRAESDFFAVGAGQIVSFTVLIKSSVAGVDNRVIVQYFDKSEVTISADSTVYSSTSNPTTATPLSLNDVVPSTAKFAKIQLIGGQTNSAAGTTYFDAVALKTARVSKGHISGLILSNDTDTAHDINITAGEAGLDNDIVTVMGTEITKQIDAAWAAGDDAGGMFTGSVANSTWYHVFIISGSSGVDAGFDISVTAANIPSGYTNYRRIGSAKTDGSANIIQFIQVADLFYWASPPEDVNAGSEALTTLSIPLGVKVFAHFGISVLSGGVDNAAYVFSDDITNEAESFDTGRITTGRQDTGSGVGGSGFALSNTSSQVRIRADGTIDVTTFGWRDFRGEY